MPTESYMREPGQWRRLRDGLIVPVGEEAGYPGDPGAGNHLIGWANGPGSGGAGSLSAGNGWSDDKVSVYHDYSTASNGTVSQTFINRDIAAGVISSQSFKINATDAAGIVAGEVDAALTAAAQFCISKEPWPIWLCYFHEPGGNFNTQALRTQYRAAWRYIVNRFRNEGAGSNINFQCILEAPYDFRPSNYSPGGGRGIDWRELHPDWNGGNTHTVADWYEDTVLDSFGIDVYNPLVGGTSFQAYDLIWQSVTDEWEADAFPAERYSGINVMEMGWSDVINPDPDWNAYADEVLEVAHSVLPIDIKCFTWWDNNNDSPRRYAFSAASDANGDKLSGWETLVDAATVWEAP